MSITPLLLVAIWPIAEAVASKCISSLICTEHMQLLCHADSILLEIGALEQPCTASQAVKMISLVVCLPGLQAK